MPLLAFSQTKSKGNNTSLETPRIGILESVDGEILYMDIKSAKVIASDLIDYNLLRDSIIPEYEREVTLYSQTTLLNIGKIKKLESKNMASEQQINNLKDYINNLQEIGGFKDMTIEEAEKAIKKEKIKKGLGIGGGALGGVGVGIIIGFFLAK
tara:strand:+ start:35032 stop:35493 length:462 start_codon:yes stop_codon:yes gene_type:complete